MSRRRVLALIPARGGSKGLPGKNLAKIAGREMIGYSIDAARGCGLVDRVVVSTDSPRIARAARRLGAEAPFLRPAALARDATPVLAPMRHALDWLRREEGWRADVVVLLQPTSPLRTARHLREALSLFLRSGADTVVGVTEPHPHPYRCVRFERGRMRFAVPRPARRLNRQDYPEVWAINGALYITRAELVERGLIYGPRVRPYPMGSRESLDIDTREDLELARWHLRGR